MYSHPMAFTGSDFDAALSAGTYIFCKTCLLMHDLLELVIPAEHISSKKYSHFSVGSWPLQMTKALVADTSSIQRYASHVPLRFSVLLQLMGQIQSLWFEQDAHPKLAAGGSFLQK